MTGLHVTGDFKRLYWTTGTVVPTGDGLHPAHKAEKFDLPYFAKGTKGCFFVFLRTSFVG